MANEKLLPEHIAEARAIHSEAREIVRQVEQTHRENWRRRTGPIVESMLASRSSTEQMLANADGQIRAVAMEILVDIWQANDSDFIAHCRNRALTDPDLRVRAIALTCLGRCLEGTGNGEFGRFFAVLVSDPSASVECRVAAYFGLLYLTGQFAEKPELIISFRFPDDVDWRLVESFLCQ